MTYNDIINRIATIYDRQEARAIARRLLEEAFGLSLTDIALGLVEKLSANETTRLEQMLRRLEESEPLQYVMGKTTFCGYAFRVREGVLIPRPETEQLVEMAAEAAKQAGTEPRILDIGTGSGCIAISVYRKLRDEGRKPLVTACDISPGALGIAQENAERLKAEIRFVKCDILSPDGQMMFNGEEFDIIVSNPPYICQSEAQTMHANVLRHEPHTALFVPDDDAMLFYRNIAAMARRTLKHDGRLLFEINRNYGKETSRLLAQTGYADVETVRDIYGNPRFVTARKQN